METKMKAYKNGERVSKINENMNLSLLSEVELKMSNEDNKDEN